MCETLGTDWENTAKQQIVLKLEAWKVIARVRELHTPDESDWNDEFNPCPSCGDYGLVLYPCPTIQALDGEQ